MLPFQRFAPVVLLAGMLAGCPSSEETPEVLVERGNLLREEGRFDEAGDVYRDAIKGFRGYLEDEPNNGYVWFQMGEVYFHLGEVPKSLEAYQKSMDFSREYAEMPYAWYQVATLHDLLGNAPEALEAYNMAIRYDPAYPEAYADRGYFHQNVLNDNDSALRDFNEAIRLNAEFAFAYRQRAIVYAATSEFERALQDIDTAIDLAPEDAFALVIRGEIRHELGQFDAAVDDFQQALELDAEFASAYHGRSMALRELGRDQEADADLRRALELDPSLATAGPAEAMPDPATFAFAAVTAHLEQHGYTSLQPRTAPDVFRLQAQRDGAEASVYIAASDGEGHVRVSDAELAAIRSSPVPVDLVVISQSQPASSWEVTSIVRDWEPADADLRPVQFEIAIP